MSRKGAASGGGRAGFLNAQKSAAISETIKKEERTLHRMLEKQIELGRIVLPAEGPEDDGAAQADERPDEAAVDRQMEWLLAAHRGSGLPAPSPAAARGARAGAGAAEADGAQQSSSAGGSPASQPGAAPSGSAPAASSQQDGASEEENPEALLQQMRDISRSIWSTLSSGMASGTVSVPSSRTKADFGYSQAAVEAMWDSGELDAKHHRRRDAHSRYVEASARDAAMRRGAAAPPKDG